MMLALQAPTIRPGEEWQTFIVLWLQLVLHKYTGRSIIIHTGSSAKGKDRQDAVEGMGRGDHAHAPSGTRRRPHGC